MNLANHDLRAWMKEVDSIGQLHRIQGVPWDKDMGGLLEMILERSKHPPALLFEKIPDARQDIQILCSQIDGIQRLALAMGTDPKLGTTDFIQAWRQKIRNFQPVEPEYVKDAPIFENRLHPCEAAHLWKIDSSKTKARDKDIDAITQRLVVE